MKLYEIPAGSKFHLVDDEEKKLLKFFNIVNMSTEIKDEHDNLVLGIPPYAEVEIVK